MEYGFDFRPGKEGLRKVLGDLEYAIMDVAWEREIVTVRDVHEDLQKDRVLAYTTVLTVMKRLTDKGLLQCETSDRAHVYRPVLSRDRFTRSVVRRVVDALLHDFSEPTMACIVEEVETAPPDRVQALWKVLHQKVEGALH